MNAGIWIFSIALSAVIRLVRSFVQLSSSNIRMSGNISRTSSMMTARNRAWSGNLFSWMKADTENTAPFSSKKIYRSGSKGVIKAMLSVWKVIAASAFSEVG
jgi:hypothetical protein